MAIKRILKINNSWRELFEAQPVKTMGTCAVCLSCHLAGDNDNDVECLRIRGYSIKGGGGGPECYFEL